MLERYAETWSGEYRGVPYRVIRGEWIGANPHSPFSETWTYYIYLRQPQLPPGVFAKMNLQPEPDVITGKLCYRWSQTPIASDLYWHGGLSFYEKHWWEDEKTVTIHLGCDYQHLGDEHRTYSCECVAADARHTIDSLRELVPDLRVHCSMCGAWYVGEGNARSCPECAAKECADSEKNESEESK